VKAAADPLPAPGDTAIAVFRLELRCSTPTLFVLSVLEAFMPLGSIADLRLADTLLAATLPVALLMVLLLVMPLPLGLVGVLSPALLLPELVAEDVVEDGWPVTGLPPAP